MELTIEQVYEYCDYKDKDGYWSYPEGRCFEDDVKAVLGITDNPKADKLMGKAYEMGHSSGRSGIFGYALDLVDLIK